VLPLTIQFFLNCASQLRWDIAPYLPAAQQVNHQCVTIASVRAVGQRAHNFEVGPVTGAAGLEVSALKMYTMKTDRSGLGIGSPWVTSVKVHEPSGQIVHRGASCSCVASASVSGCKHLCFLCAMSHAQPAYFADLQGPMPAAVIPGANNMLGDFLPYAMHNATFPSTWPGHLFAQQMMQDPLRDTRYAIWEATPGAAWTCIACQLPVTASQVVIGGSGARTTMQADTYYWRHLGCLTRAVKANASRACGVVALNQLMAANLVGYQIATQATRLAVTAELNAILSSTAAPVCATKMSGRHLQTGGKGEGEGCRKMRHP